MCASDCLNLHLRPKQNMSFISYFFNKPSRPAGLQFLNDPKTHENQVKKLRIVAHIVKKN